MTEPQIIVVRRYLIDTSALGDLEGTNFASQYTPDESIKERIWKGLENLAIEGRLATVYASKDDIRRRIPAIMPRLEALPGFFLPDSATLFAEVTRVLSLSPNWQKRVRSAKPNRDPPDQYLVAMAALNGYTVVTNEKHRKDRPANFKAGDNIPDVCDRRGVAWLYLEGLVAEESL